MTGYLDEAKVALVTVDYFRELGYGYVHRPDSAPDGEAPERADYGQVVLAGRLRDALARINRELPDEALEDAFWQVTRTDGLSLVVNSRGPGLGPPSATGREQGMRDASKHYPLSLWERPADEGCVEALSPLPLGEGQGEGSVEEFDRLFADVFADSELGEIPGGWAGGKSVTCWSFRKVRANADQGPTHGGLRDTLLPKLLSGEIEIPETEAIAEEVPA